MALKIVEFFGYAPGDRSEVAQSWRSSGHCPFIGERCVKSQTAGTCTVRQASGDPVVCCPVRLYCDSYRILQDVAVRAFGDQVRLISPDQYGAVHHDGNRVVMFGKHSGHELKLPKRSGGSGGYFVDWVLARIDASGALGEFVAVEVQSIDTTGNYQDQRQAIIRGETYEGMSSAGLNWENVSKRILPQIIYKGHVLRRERKCNKGLFFVTPAPVYSRIRERLGGNLLSYNNLQPGSLTFLWYDVGGEVESGRHRPLELAGEFRTTVDQVATAFTSPTNLPPENVYEASILEQLKLR